MHSICAARGRGQRSKWETKRERYERITSESNIESKSNLHENEQTAQHANDNCFICIVIWNEPLFRVNFKIPINFNQVIKNKLVSRDFTSLWPNVVFFSLLFIRLMYAAHTKRKLLHPFRTGHCLRWYCLHFTYIFVHACSCLLYYGFWYHVS